MNEMQQQNILMLPVSYNGKEYLTSNRIHADYKDAGGEKYISMSEFNRMIRGIEAYPDYLISRNIIELAHKSQVIDFPSNADLAVLIKSNSYKPIMLLDRAAKKNRHRNRKTLRWRKGGSSLIRCKGVILPCPIGKNYHEENFDR